MKLMTCNALNYLSEPTIIFFYDGGVCVCATVNFYEKYSIFVQYGTDIFKWYDFEWVWEKV
jgi:hypothetical protein